MTVHDKCRLPRNKSAFTTLTAMVLLMTCIVCESRQITEDKLKAVEQIKMDDKEYDRVKDVHDKWYRQAINSMMGAIGRQMFERRSFLHCLDHNGDEVDLSLGAECIIHAYDKTIVKLYKQRRRSKRSAKTPNSLKQFIVAPRASARLNSPRLRRLKKRDVTEQLRSQQASPGFKRHSRGQHQRPKRSPRLERLRSKPSFRDPFVKMKDRLPFDTFSDFEVKVVSRLPNLNAPREEKSAVRRVTGMISELVDPSSGWKHVSDQLKNINSLSLLAKNVSQYGGSLKDIVTDYDPKYRKKQSFTKRYQGYLPDVESMPKMLKGAYELVNVLEKHTDQINTKILSPRFMPLVNSKAESDTSHVLSPNIMPFYKDDSPNSVLPLPDIIDATGLKPDDREAILDLVMHMSGAEQIVQDAFKIFRNNETMALVDDVNGITEAMEKMYNQLKEMFTPKQRREITQQQFTFMNPDQLNKFYGDNGPFNNSLSFTVDHWSGLSDKQKMDRMMEDIRTLATDRVDHNLPNGTRTRKKRGLTVLAPFSFGPGILSPAALGPAVFSPNLFSPAIVSPTVLSPPVFTPSIGSPMIVSPYVLSPNTVSPAIFEVYVLSPYFIAPNVINPYVMSPIILSPHMLCPDVLSPTILSGAILNPYFLGPAILTESALAADILSPSFMSKKKK